MANCHGEGCLPSKDIPRLSSGGLKRTISDISMELSNETTNHVMDVAPILEVEDAKCECCGLSEECTPEFIDEVQKKFFGKWICGLCAEAADEEMKKKGGSREDALEAHITACLRFNKFGRVYPVLSQANAMREMLKKNASDGARPKSIAARDKNATKNAGIARTSSCMPAITKQINAFKLAN